MTTASQVVLTTQAQGFLASSRIVANFTTTSLTFVDTGVTIANVPNSCKILYNLWVGATAGLTTSWQLLANATVINSGTTTLVSVQLKDYSGTFTNTTGVSATVKVQIKTNNASDPATLFAASPNNSGILCYNGASAIVIQGGFIPASITPLGKCQISSLAFAMISSTLALPASETLGILSAGFASTATITTASITLPNKQQFPNIPFTLPANFTDVDVLLVIDFTGDLVTLA
jgi:hypothetical protein